MSANLLLLLAALLLLFVSGLSSSQFEEKDPAGGKAVPPPASFDAWLKHMSDTTSTGPSDHQKLPGKPLTDDDDDDEDDDDDDDTVPAAGSEKPKDFKGVKLVEVMKAKAKKKRNPYVVAKDGSGIFTSVQAAIDKVPNNNQKRVVIYIKKGVYREKIKIPSNKPYITLKGDGAQLTFLEWNDTASVIGPTGKPLSTYGSASVAVESDNFIAMDISFRNTAPAPPSGAVGKQAVALRISGDKAAFYNCYFYGAQDTLYDHKGRHYFFRCFIQGSIDFIFGNGRSLYVKCHLKSIAAPYGSLTAQKRTLPAENTGFSFVRCLVTGSGSIYLGRSWGPFSRVVYSLTYFDNIIVPQGWNDWSIPANQKTVFYGEYKCSGPGANRSGRVKWSRQLTKAQAKPFLHIGFINGEKWLPK